MEKKEEVDFSKLRFIRVFTPMHVPKYLVEQIKDRDFSIDDWYKYHETICVRQTQDGPALNPLSLLYVIADEDNKVVGVLWGEIDVLSKTLVVHVFSIDSKYWNRGKAVVLVADKAREIGKECKLKKIVWATRGPKHSEYYGFKKAKETIMEYDLEEDPGYGKKSIQRKRKTNRDSTADGPCDEKPADGDDAGAGAAG